MDKKIKVLVISDDIRSPSGVGTQTKYIVEALMKTGRFQVVYLGGAVRHEDTRPMKITEFGDDFISYPVEGYGNQDIVRSIVRTHRPDMIMWVSDPRFYYWLWQIENEIRPLIPMVYYHVWDAPPNPNFNKVLYESTDIISTISRVTHHIVQNVAPSVEEYYIPHSVNTNVFRKYDQNEPISLPNNQNITLSTFKRESFKGDEDKTIFFWNNRNARRKQSGTLIWWFKEFMDKVGHDKVKLILHTEPKDPNGQDLFAIVKELGLEGSKSVVISQQKVLPEMLSLIYNCVDAVINISDAEGFGLGTMEALACETPIIVNMTGGLQEQVYDLTNVDVSEKFMLERNKNKGYTVYPHGIGIEPASKSVIGSQEVPFIWEDRINKDDFINAMMCFYNMPKVQREEMGKRGREHILKNYNFEEFGKKWVELLEKTHHKYGSWPNKLYRSYELRNI